MWRSVLTSPLLGFWVPLLSAQLVVLEVAARGLDSEFWWFVGRILHVYGAVCKEGEVEVLTCETDFSLVFYKGGFSWSCSQGGQASWVCWHLYTELRLWQLLWKTCCCDHIECTVKTWISVIWGWSADWVIRKVFVVYLATSIVEGTCIHTVWGSRALLLMFEFTRSY